MVKLIIICGLDNDLLENKAHELEKIHTTENVFLFPECESGKNRLHSQMNQRFLTNRLIELSSIYYPVCIVTQSDIVFYTIRVAIKKRILLPQEVEVLWHIEKFTHKIHIDIDGKISRWPYGFFDQMDQLLSELV